jgi:hypothetical protein
MALEALLDFAGEELAPLGARRILGPLQHICRLTTTPVLRTRKDGNHEAQALCARTARQRFSVRSWEASPSRSTACTPPSSKFQVCALGQATVKGSACPAG